LQKWRADWFNPISQFIVRCTEKPLKPFQKIVPGFRGFDLSIVLLALLLQLAEVLLLWWINTGSFPRVLGVLMMTIGELASNFIYIYIYAIVIDAIFSWFPALQAHALAHITRLIANPVLMLVRRWIPFVAGIDISPILALLFFTIINLLLVQPLVHFGMQLGLY